MTETHIIQFRKLILLISFFCSFLSLHAQPVDSLIAKVNLLNDEGEYEKSVYAINEFLTGKPSNEDVYHAQMLLADTYKRLFDYPRVFHFLKSARKTAARSTKNRLSMEDNVRLQEALAYFDIQRYDVSKQLMQDIVKTGFRNLDCENHAYIMMQLGYIDYLDGNYKHSENAYEQAGRMMSTCSPCDLPVIYGKQISLYGKQGNVDRMNEIYRKGNTIANRCKIRKYNLYLAEVMRNTFQEMKEYEQAFRYFRIFDSLNSIYNADGYKSKLSELEVKYNSSQKEKAIEVQRATIMSRNRLIFILAAVVVIMVLIVIIVYFIQQRKKVVEDRRKTLLFTRQLLTKIEDERKRIAGDLHDSVNNELLFIRTGIDRNPEIAKERVDQLIEFVRMISRDLHPVMFEEMGLKDSIEQLVERLQEQHIFPIQSEIDYHEELDPEAALQLYRIIQESVNNILRYSEAVAGIIRLYYDHEKLILEIQDNGKGFDITAALDSPNSFGLRNMIERGYAVNGQTTIYSDNSGTLITVKVPLPANRKRS